MKSTQSKKPASRSTPRKSATSKALRSSKKSHPPGSGQSRAHQATPPAAAVARPAPEKPVVSTQSEVGSSAAHHEILEEIRALRAMVTAVPVASAGTDTDGDLESAVDSMRRVFSEFLERRTDQFLEELAGVRDALARPERRDSGEALRRIDVLLGRWGAHSFSASKLDHVDPAIHEVVAERNVPGLPEGVVVETLRPGMRADGGRLLCKAQVAVNWKGAHEPAGH
jgi:molecular chaperone GrpE (heat shock protein)